MTVIPQALKQVAVYGAWASGGLAVLRAWTRRGRGFHVFCYHRIGTHRGPFFPGMPLDAFRTHCRYLRRHYRVLPLGELLARARRGEPLGDAAAVTFDDGYRDNLLLALPVLEEFGLPVTVFLTTEPLDTGRPLWHDRVAYLLERTRRERLTLPLGGETLVLDLASVQSRLALVEPLIARLKALPEAEKQAACARLEEAADLGDYRGLAGDMLTWEDVRAMAARGVEFGAHTVTHPILSRLPLPAARREILESARRISAEVGRPCALFAYPNGLPGDFTPALEELLAREGFLGAVSRGFAANPSGGNPYDVRRWTPDPSVVRTAVRMAWLALRT